MNIPTEPGYYVGRFKDTPLVDEIFLLCENGNEIQRIASDLDYYREDIVQWRLKIELPQEYDAEYIQNYVDPLRDPDRLWNV